MADLRGPALNLAAYGRSTAVLEDTLFVGSPTLNPINEAQSIRTGAVDVYRIVSNDYAHGGSGLARQQECVQPLQLMPSQTLLPWVWDDPLFPRMGFGTSVATDGEWLLVGAPSWNDDACVTVACGIVFAFRLVDNIWQPSQLLTRPPVQLGGVGRYVDVDGDVAVLHSAEGPAVFHLRNGSWQFEATLRPLGNTCDSAVVDGKLILVSCRELDSAFVFRWDGQRWVQHQQLLAPDFSFRGQEPRHSVALNKQYAVVTGYKQYSLQDGEIFIYVYARSDPGTPDNAADDMWIADGTLQVPTGADLWHGQFAIVDDTIALITHTAQTSWESAIYLLRKGDDGWAQVGRLTRAVAAQDTEDPGPDSMALSNSFAVLGVDGDNRSAQDAGAVSVFAIGGADCDNDGRPDYCECNDDNDPIPNDCDNCATEDNADQLDSDRDGFGDACDCDIDFDCPDSDSDGHCDLCEEVNCTPGVVPVGGIPVSSRADHLFPAEGDSACQTRATASDGRIRIDLPIDRYLGTVDNEGHLEHWSTMVANRVAGEYAILTISAFDIDFRGRPIGERDRVWFNGEPVTRFVGAANPSSLLGADGVWSCTSFRIPIGKLKPARIICDSAAACWNEPGLNVVEIHLDDASQESGSEWAAAVPWATLTVDVAPPIVLIHGYISSRCSWNDWALRFDSIGAVWNAPNLNGIVCDKGPTDPECGRACGYDGLESKIAFEPTLEIASALLRAYMDVLKARWGVEKVTLVGHSKGTITGRHFLLHYSGTTDTDRFVQIAPPNGGVPLDIFRWIFPVGPDLVSRFRSAFELTSVPMAMYNQANGPPPGVTTYTIGGIYRFCCGLGSWMLQQWVENIVGGASDPLVPLWSVNAIPWSVKLAPIMSQGDVETAWHWNIADNRHVFDRLLPLMLGKDEQIQSSSMTDISMFGSPHTGVAVHILDTWSAILRAGEGDSHGVNVDAGFDTLIVSTLVDGADARVTILSPSGTPRACDQRTRLPVVDDCVDCSDTQLCAIAEPQSGTWVVEVALADRTLSEPFPYHVTVQAQGGARATVCGVSPTTGVVGSPVMLTVEHRELGAPLLGVAVNAAIGWPGGEIDSGVQLLDDGVIPDVAANDGVYTGDFVPLQSGEYAIEVHSLYGGNTGTSSRKVLVVPVAPSLSTLAEVLGERVIDVDDDGLIDALEIPVIVDAGAAGILQLRGDLVAENGIRVGSVVVRREVETGNNAIVVAFDGLTIYGAASDGPYSLELVVAVVDSGVAFVTDRRLSAYTTGAYAFSEFEHSDLAVEGVVSSQLLDTNSNGNGDRLLVGVSVDAVVAGQYDWSASLRHRCNGVIGFAAGSELLFSGRNVVELSFSGDAIGASGIDGPYDVVDLLIRGGGPDAIRSLVVANVGSTDSFAAADFEDYSPPADCNENEVPDTCDLTDGKAVDLDGNGVLDACEASGDYDGDVDLDLSDVSAFLRCFGPVEGGPRLAGCLEIFDYDGDTYVDNDDWWHLARTLTGPLPPHATCEDGLHNQDEDGLDCGGACAPCECQADLDCDDGLLCTGVEVCAQGHCISGPAELCDDGVVCTIDWCDTDTDSCFHLADDISCDDDNPCTVDSCDEDTGSCVNVPDDSKCNDGQYCNGQETCDSSSGCRPGMPIECDDAIPCTVDSCDEENDVCGYVADDSLCDTGLFCDGAGVCDSILGCLAGSDPCPGLSCDESADRCAPHNDDCQDAAFVTDGVTSFHTDGATTDGPDEPLACNFYGYTHIESDIWYRYIATCTGQLTISLCGSEYDTKLAIYDGCEQCGSPDMPVACDDDACGAVEAQSEVQLSVAHGVCYTIRVGGYSGVQGQGMMAVTCEALPMGACCHDGTCLGTMTEADCSIENGTWYENEDCATFTCPVLRPPHDECVECLALVTGEPYEGTTLGATGADVSSCADQDHFDVWHCWTADCDGAAVVDLCDSGFDTTLSVYDACDGSELACNDDSCGLQSRIDPTDIVFPVTSGTTYYLRVAGYYLTTGAYGLVVESCASACCMARGTSCAPLTADECVNTGGGAQPPGAMCLGDADRDGIDDVCD